MTRRYLFALIGLFAFLTGNAALAENGVMVVHVTYLDKKPLPRVRISVVKEGSTEKTGSDGKARLRLAAGVKEEQEITLQVVPLAHDKGPWVFVSPWNQRVRVPPFSGDEAVPVVLARKADKDALLGSSEGRKALEQSILSGLSKLRQAKSEITDEQRRTVLLFQAAAYGLKPEEVDAAIRAAAQKSPDLYEQGLAALYEKNYPVASERLEKALVASEKEFAQAQEKVADRAFFLGQSLYEQGRYQESVVALRRATELRGENAETLNLLGMALESAGNFPEAEKVLNRGLEADPRMSSTLRADIQSDLALVLKDRGDLIGARLLCEQVLEVRRRELGTDHMDTLSAMNTLADTFYAEGDLQKARLLEEQVLESLSRQFGADHPNTLKAMNNLAEMLNAQGDLQKARQLEEQVLESFRRQLGADHPDTLKAMNNLAVTLDAQGDLPKGRQLQEQVLESRRRQLGADHPDTLTAMNNLAESLRAQGELTKARQLQEQVLEARRRILGPKHSDTSAIEWNLLLTLVDLGDQVNIRELEKNLAWLLDADESKLPAQQRDIAERLRQRQEGQRKQLFIFPVQPATNAPTHSSRPLY